MRTPHIRRTALLAGALGISALFGILGLYRHREFGSGGYDLGIFDQVLWHWSRGERPESTVLGLAHIWADHLHPLLTLLSPLYLLHRGPETLILIQALFLGSSAIPVFLWCETRLGSTSAALWTGAYVLHWGFQIAACYDFHDSTLALPFIALALWLLDTGRNRALGPCLALLLLVREDMGLLVAGLGLLAALRGRRGLGALIFLSGALWFYLALAWIIPHFEAPGGHYGHWSYGALGASPGAALIGLIKKPWLALTLFVDHREKVRTLLSLFGPFLFLSLASPLALLLVPVLGALFWSDAEIYWISGFHHAAPAIPILAMAGADGLSRLLDWRGPAWDKVRITKLVSALSLALGLANIPNLPLRAYFIAPWRSTSPFALAGEKALLLIPETASVTAQDKILPHLSCRAEIYEFQEPLVRSEFLVAAEDLDPFPFKKAGDLRKALKRVLDSGDYERLATPAGWWILRRKKV